MPFKYREPMDRIIANSVLDPLTGCWNWIGRTITNRSGQRYPVLNIRWKGGKRKGKVRTVLAHRYVVAIVEGVPLHCVKVSMHLCNNTICVNPDKENHLRRGTYRQNNMQAIDEGRR